MISHNACYVTFNLLTSVTHATKKKTVTILFAFLGYLFRHLSVTTVQLLTFVTYTCERQRNVVTRGCGDAFRSLKTFALKR